MGLDIYVKRIYKNPPKKFNTVEEVNNFLNENDIYSFPIDDQHELKDVFKKHIRTIPVQFYDFEETFKILGLDYQYYYLGNTLYKQNSLYTFYNDDGKELTIKESELTVKIEYEDVLFAYNTEKGYQCRGQNYNFYSYFHNLDQYCFARKKTILEIYKKCFHGKDFDGDKLETKFKRNIIDNFTPGSDIVVFSY